MNDMTSEAAADTVLYEVSDGVATLTLNRPERTNAWTPAMGTRYFDLLDRAEADTDVRAIVVTGAGKGFCPGADMEILQAVQDGGISEGAGETRRQTYALSIRKPIIAAINGACAGIGLVLALMCDVRFAAPEMKFTTAFARRGLVAEHGVSWILPRLIGPSKAFDLLASARVFKSEEALELGVVNRVVPLESVVTEARAYALDLARNCSPASMATIKHQIYGHMEWDLGAAIAESDLLMQASLKQPDFREGVMSYVEKRPPRFEPLGNASQKS